MKYKKTIGGFFELEISNSKNETFYHSDAIALTSGRSCLNLIFSLIMPKKVYLPYYVCDAALIPLSIQNIPYEFYSINKDFLPHKKYQLHDNEYFLYINYYGLMNNNIDQLYELYGHRLIIDNTQAFFEKRYKNCWSFNSARKFFGVPDGGYLYSHFPLIAPTDRNTNIRYNHLLERLYGKESAYHSYLENEANIATEILCISPLSEKILSYVSYDECITRRLNNFRFYEQALSKINILSFVKNTYTAPFCYPLLLKNRFSRHDLNKLGIFIPFLWQDTLHRNTSGYDYEKGLSSNLLPLPIDHRYSNEDCHYVVSNILNLIF